MTEHTTPTPTSRAGLLALLATAALLALCAGAVPAYGAPYTVHACRLPDGRVIPAAGWTASLQPSNMGGAGTLQDCAAGGFMGAWAGLQDGIGGGEFAQWAFRAPADTALAAFTLDRDALGWVYQPPEAPSLGFLAGVQLVARAPEGTETVLQSCPQWGGPPTGCGSLPPIVHGPLPAGTMDLVVRAGCMRLSGYRYCPDSAENGTSPPGVLAALAVFRAEVALEDRIAPRFLREPTGSLLDEEPQTGVRQLSVAAADRGGGIRTVALELDGSPWRSFAIDADVNCREPFTAPVPCPLAIDRRLAVDLGGTPNGTHRLRVLVTDATGRNTVAAGPYTITTAGRGAPNGAPASDDAELTVRLARDSRRGRETRALRYGARTTLRGRLTAPDDRPLARATLVVSARTRAPGRRWRQVGTVTTTKLGAYAWNVPRGPSRELRVSYRAFSLDSADSARASTGLRVRAPVAFDVDRERLHEGGAATFAGRLPGAPRPRGGKLVELQAIDRGRWRTFATVRADRRTGRFTYRYRFLRTGISRRYSFRAVSPAERSYPYEAGASRPIGMLVATD